MKKLFSTLTLIVTLLIISVDNYAADIASVTITGSQVMTFGGTPNNAFSNPYSVTITDSEGNNIADNADGLTVIWDIEGFKTSNDTEGQYCDSYGSFSVNGQDKLATTFELCNVPMNFFGRMTATVSYGGSTAKGELYVVALGNKSVASGQLLPLAGYPKDFSTYPKALEGYNILKDTYGANHDIIFGGWSVSGSDNGMSGQLLSDADGTKFVKFSSTTPKKSHIMTNAMSAFSGQVLYVAKLRFPTAGATMTLTAGYPMWQSKSNYFNPVTVNYDGTNITINNVKLEKNGSAVTFAKNTWYNVVLSADKSTETCYCNVYSTDGTLLGSSPITAWADSSSPTFFSIGMQNSAGAGSVDVASCEAYVPTINPDSYSLTADKTTLSIPNGETAVLTAAVKDTRGYEITQKATWSIVEPDMQQSVTITPSASDSHMATITLPSTAEAGTATVLVNIGGVTKTIPLTLTSSAESVKFTSSTTSITIPLETGSNATATYAASVVDGSGTDLGRNVTLKAYEKDGVTPLNNANITFDAQSGTLSVNAAVQPTQVVITATSQNSDNESIAKSIIVNIHGLTFDFGYTTDNGIADGYTAVGTNTTYNDIDGYGIASGTPTVGGTASATDATKDYLSGGLTFNVKVQKGSFYTVSITYSGTLTTGYVSTDLAGYTLGTHTAMQTEEYAIPATCDFIDLCVTDTIAQISISKQSARQKRSKPVIHDIGDSTAANNGSWAYRLASLTNGGSYQELTNLCTFQSQGRGGQNLATYYTKGYLANVLATIYPGDIVILGNMGTNGMGNTFEADVNYYLDAVEALGAKVILNSYTPHGAVSNYASGYNSSTATFDSYRRDSYDNVIRSIAAQRATSDANYLGFVEIGKNADAIFNAYAKDYAANNYASADAAAQAIITCFTDHNHYSNGTLACDLMLNGYKTTTTKGIVQQLVDILSGNATSAVAPVATDDSQITSSVFDILGRKVNGPKNITSVNHGNFYNGLYIINGKKYLIR